MMRADGAPPLLQIDDVIPIAFYLKVCQLLLAIYLRGGDSHTNAACVHVCASMVKVRGERSGEGRGGTRCCSLTTMIERTKIPDAAQQRATVSRVDICIVGEISPFGFRLYASTLSNLSSRLVGIPPGNLSRLAETKPGPMIDSHCEID